MPHGFDVWEEPFVPLRVPRLFDICPLRSFRGIPRTAGMNWGNGGWIACFPDEVPAQSYVGKFLATFKEFPPSQKVGSFSLDQVMESLNQGRGRQVSARSKR